MYKITNDQYTKLLEVLQHIDALHLTGSNNFLTATKAIVILQYILEEIKKQEFKEEINNVS
jgi:hypothetical protein